MIGRKIVPSPRKTCVASMSLQGRKQPRDWADWEPTFTAEVSVLEPQYVFKLLSKGSTEGTQVNIKYLLIVHS